MARLQTTWIGSLTLAAILLAVPVSATAADGPSMGIEEDVVERIENNPNIEAELPPWVTLEAEPQLAAVLDEFEAELAADADVMGLLVTGVAPAPAKDGLAPVAGGGTSEGVSAMDSHVLATSGTYWIWCVGIAPNLHYSKNARGAIYKPTVTCQRSSAAAPANVTILVNGRIQYRRFDNTWFLTRASAAYSQTVAAAVGRPGKKETWWVPEEGKSGLRGTGDWRTITSMSMTAPLAVGVMTSTTKYFLNQTF